MVRILWGIRMLERKRYHAKVMGKVRVIEESVAGPSNVLESRRLVAKELLRIIETPHFWFYDNWTPATKRRTDKAVEDIKARIMKWSKWEDIPE